MGQAALLAIGCSKLVVHRRCLKSHVMITDAEYSRRRRLVGALLQDLIGKVIVHFSFAFQHLEVGILQQLRMTFTEGLADGLLYARVVQFALTGGVP